MPKSTPAKARNASSANAQGARSKRTRARRRLRVEPILAALLALSLYLGVTRSPLTSIRRVRVEGARVADEPRIRAELAKMKGIPCLQLDPYEYEAGVLNSPEVRSAALSRNVFGYALMRVAYRTPVARFEGAGQEAFRPEGSVVNGNGNWALSSDGVCYPATELPAGLPTIRIPQRLAAPSLTVASSWEPGRIAYLAGELENVGGDVQKAIWIDDQGVVLLKIGSGRVVLGSCESLDSKLQVLRDRLYRNPSELSQIAELNLTSPQRPAYTPKNPEIPH